MSEVQLRDPYLGGRVGGGSRALGKHASNRQFENSQPPPRSLTIASKDGAAAPGQLKCTEQ